MATYNEDFVAPTGFTAEAKDLISSMTAAGWAFRLSSKGHAIGRAPAPSKETVSISRSANKTNRGLQNAEAVMRRWIREQAAYASPEGLEALERVYDNGTDSPIVTAVIKRGLAKRTLDELDARVGTVPAQEFTDQDEANIAALEQAVREGSSTLVTVSSDEQTVVVGYTLTPWMAKKQPGRKGGERYPSSGVMERRWEGGRVDYVCAFPDCGWESDNPRSVSAHYGGKHTAQGEGTPWEEAVKHPVPDASYTEPGSHREYNPTARLLNALTDWLAEQMWDTEEDLALLFLTWAHERPDLEDLERKPVEAMTAEEIVARVRMLVGQPLAVKVQSMEEHMLELELQLEQRTHERDAVTAELRRVEADVEAVEELLDSIRGHRKSDG